MIPNLAVVQARRAGKSRQGTRRRIAFAQGISGPGGERRPAVDLTRRPADFDLLDVVVRAETEVEARIAGGLVAAAADALGDLASAAGGEGDPGPDAVAVGCRPFEPERDEAARPGESGCGNSARGSSWATITASTRPSLSRSPAARPRPTRGKSQGGPAWCGDVDKSAVGPALVEPAWASRTE